MNHDIFIIKFKKVMNREEFKSFYDISFLYNFHINRIDTTTWYIDCGTESNLLPKDILTWLPKSKIARVVKFGKTTDLIIKF